MNYPFAVKTLFIFLTGLIFYQRGTAQIHVNTAAIGKEDGSSWQDAYANFQDALSAAKSGEQIWVAGGTYLPGKPGDPETSTFLLTKDIQLYGGFAGTENSLAERNPSEHPTILSGDLNQDDIPNDFETNRTDNVWNVMLVKNETAGIPIIDGFTVGGGHADGEISFGNEQGGGGVFTDSPVELRNCLFTQNYARLAGGAARFAFASETQGVLSLVKGCKFSGNKTTFYGGAISIHSFENVRNTTVAIDSCFFAKNEAHGGGAINFAPSGLYDSLLVTRSSFVENKATEINHSQFSGGGAILISYWSLSKQGSASIEACSFENNSSGGTGGGAVAIKPFDRSNHSYIYDCTFTGNHTSGKGAALLYDDNNGNYELDGCTFDNNIADKGGDMFHEEKAVDSTLFFLFFHGALWIQILYSLLMFFISRERTTLYFALLVLGISVVNFFMKDVHHFSFDFKAALTQAGLIAAVRIGIVLVIFGALKFAQHYLNADEYIPHVKKIVTYYLLLFSFFEIVFFVNYSGLWDPNELWLNMAINVVNIMTLIGFVMPIILTFAVLKKGYRPALYLLPAFLLACFAGVSGLYFHVFAGGQTSTESLYGQVFVLLAITAFGLANGYRTNLLKKEKIRAEKLAELDTAKTRLYTNITHEFRTPLTVIMGASDLVKGNEPEKQLIKRNSQQLLLLINQMLDLSKLEAGALKLEPQQGDIIPFIEYLVESFQSLAASKHIQLTFYRELEVLQMDYDAEKMQQVVTNLISNAIKFTPESGKVVVHAKEEVFNAKPHLILKVRDNGSGIPKADIQHIFDRFFQVDASDMRRSEGSGIGLALVRELVQLMKGKIDVTSTEGKGTEFVIQIPISREAPIAEQAALAKSSILVEVPVENEVVAPFQPFADDLPLALIIEDNKDVVSFLRSCLERKYKLEVAFNGQQGINMALDIVPDIIISDVMMPEADGYTVCRTLKNDERTSHIPIILLTAKATQEDRVHGLDMGADAYLSKPFHREELEIRLGKLIELRQQLQKRYQSFHNHPFSAANREDIFIQKLRTVIEENIEDESFGITELCQAVSLSRMQVHRKLKALTDMPATQFIHTIRLQKAYQLLVETDLNVSEVAFKVGFSDHSYFTKLFVRQFDQTPSELRGA